MRWHAFLGIVALLLLGRIAGSARAYDYVAGDYWQASRDWTAAQNPDDDYYGTAAVWAYQYNTDDADFDPANHQNLPNWTGSLWNLVPSGAGYYCMLHSSGGHPDLVADPIRTWTSPVKGNVRVSGSLSRGSLSPSGMDGVTGYIHQNTSQLWTAVVSPTDTTESYDFVTRVNAGDKIAFRVSPNTSNCCDSFSFNPTITNMGTITYRPGDYWKASEDWTGAGVVPRDPDKYGTADVWRYQHNTNDADFNPDNHVDMPNWTGSQWNMAPSGTGYYCMIWANGGHPETVADSIRTWTSPVSGTVRLTGTLADSNHNGTNGVIGYIHREQQQLWTEIIPNASSSAYDITTKVRPGERISFRVNPHIDQNSDSYSWNPRIELTGPYGLIGQWDFNEGSGATAADSSGANYGSGGQPINFTITSPIAWDSPGVDPKIHTGQGSALHIPFGAQVTADRSFPIASGHAGITLDFWFKYHGSAEADHYRQFLIDANGAVHVFLERAGTADDYYWVPRGSSYVDSGGILSWATATGTTRILPETWYHMAMTYDGSETALYLNGELEATYQQLGTMNPGNKWLRLGYGHTDWEFDGELDYIRLWDYALSAQEIFANYQAIIPEPSSLVSLLLGIAVLGAYFRNRRANRPKG